MSSVEYIKTGIRGVDEVLQGKGIPKSFMIFVLGSPGSGKTCLGMQFLFEGAVNSNEPGLYVSLDEDPAHLRANLMNLGLDINKLEVQKKLMILDASPLRLVPGEVKVGSVSIGKREFTLVSLIEMIQRAVKQIDAKRLVIDPLTTLVLQYPSEAERRNAVLDLMQGILPLKCTTFLISELQETSLDRSYQFEEYLAQGVIILRRVLRPGGVLRVFTVEKMRGIDHDPQPHPYKIRKGGIEVYPSEIAL